MTSEDFPESGGEVPESEGTGRRNIRPVEGPSELDIEKVYFQRAIRDPEEFMFFYLKYYDSIYNLAWNMIRNEEDAKDIVAQTFFQAFDKRSKFQFKGYTMGAWLFKIATNLGLQEIRRRRVRNFDREYDIERIQDGELDPLQYVVTEEEASLVRRSLTFLDALSRTIVILYYFHGVSVTEIGCTLGMNRNTIKSRLMRARTFLEEILADVLANGPPREWPDDEGWPNLRLIDGLPPDEGGPPDEASGDDAEDEGRTGGRDSAHRTDDPEDVHADDDPAGRTDEEPDAPPGG